MLLIEVFFRFGSIGILCVIGILILRDGRHIAAFRLALPLIVALICLFLTTGSDGLVVSGVVAIPMRLFDACNFIFIWWFSLALFEDEFRLGLREWGVAALFAMIVVPARLWHLGFEVPWFATLSIPAFLCTLALMTHLAYRAVIGRHEDLVESRRKIRVWFAVALALVVVTSLVTERVALALDSDPFVSLLFTYVVTFVLGIWAILWLTRLNPSALSFQYARDLPNPASEPVSKIDPRDAEAHQRLVKIMETGREYAHHGLTIGDLAEKLSLPQHQLRTLINRSMGYRNFSAFLNHYRLAEVKRALADPKNGRLPILTIAIEAGFSSLAPFNRAFKSSVGVTPTTFRAAALAKNGLDSPDLCDLPDQN